MSQQTLVCPELREFKLRAGFEPDGPEHVRMFMVGGFRTGKSSFVASAENALIVDSEKKLRYVKEWGSGSQCWVPEPEGARTALDVWDALHKQLCALGVQKKHPFQLVVLDTIDEFMERVLIPGMTTRLPEGGKLDANQDIRDYGSGGGKGSKGWNMITNRMLRYLWDLHSAGYGWIVCGHQKEEKASVRQGGQIVEVTRTRPAVNPATYGGIFRACTVFAVPTVRPEQAFDETTITLPGGRKIPKRTERSVLRYVIGLSAKAPDSDTMEGSSNLPLPSELIHNLGRGWQDYAAAHRHALGMATADGSASQETTHE